MQSDSPIENKYVYVFVRQDISLEQQMVQSAHATFKLGTHFPESDADETYFVLVGVRNLDALEAVEEILGAFGFKWVNFFEPDIDGSTAVATAPIAERDKGVLQAFSLLRAR